MAHSAGTDPVPTPELELTRVVAGIVRYAARRGGAVAAAPTLADVRAALVSRELRFRVDAPATAPATAAAIVDGTRQMRRPLSVLIIAAAGGGTEKLLQVERFRGLLRKTADAHKDADVLIVNRADHLRASLQDVIATFAAERSVAVEYRPYRTFVIDVAKHVHAQAAKHAILPEEECRKICRFYRIPPQNFAPLAVKSPLAFLAGAVHGDLVAVTGGSPGAPTCNIRYASAGVNPVTPGQVL